MGEIARVSPLRNDDMQSLVTMQKRDPAGFAMVAAAFATETVPAFGTISFTLQEGKIVTKRTEVVEKAT